MTMNEKVILTSRAKANGQANERQHVGPPNIDKANPIAAAPDGDIPLPGT